MSENNALLLKKKELLEAKLRLAHQQQLISTQKMKAIPTAGEAISRKLAQGFSFGLSDEIEAGVRSGLSFLTTPGSFADRKESAGLTFDTSMADQEARLAAVSREFPKLSFGSEAAGGVATGAGLFGLASKIPAIAKAPLALRVPGIGAAEGAVYGFGTTTGADRVPNAITGGLFGAATTPLALGIGVAASNTLRPAARRLGDSLFGTPRDRAVKEVMKALDADDITRQEALVLMKSSGRGTVLADLGDTLQRSGRVVTSQAGPAASRATRFLDERQLKGQMELRQVARRATGADTFDKGIVEIINGAETKAKPIYDEVYSQVLDVTPSMLDYLQRPAMQGARRRAATILKNEGFSDDIVNDITDVRYMDAIKRALDDDISSAVRQGNNNQARVLTNLKRDFIGEIDNQVPRYAEARSVFAGERAIKEAADFGGNVLVGNKRLSDITEVISGYGESELQAARAGFLDWLSDELANQSVRGNTLTNKFANVPKFQQTLEALFPSRAAVDDFIQTASKQSRFANTRNVVTGGSPTARIQADRAGLEQNIFGVAAEAAVNPIGALSNAMRLIKSNTQLTPEVMEEMGKILFNPKITDASLRRSFIPNLLDIPRMSPVRAAGAAGGFAGSIQDESLLGARDAGLLGQ